MFRIHDYVQPQNIELLILSCLFPYGEILQYHVLKFLEMFTLFC